MCGILGKINVKQNTITDTDFSEALNLMEHRGPDDWDIMKSNHFVFGHRRLSIIDLDPHAKQPMISDCGNFVLTFNGEIYNYREIKEELVAKGYTFRTSSDTEVLLQSFIEFGIDCIQKLIGMFAFGIYDIENDLSYIVRDRLGIKPLYYYDCDEELIFSSEIKSILKLSPNQRKLDLNAVSSYLSFRYPILSNTFFEGIKSLTPGHYLKIEKGEVKKVEYWDVSVHFKKQTEDKGEEYYIEKLKDILQSSVKYRMIADVPIGSFLSGGVDSSVITALMSLNMKEPVKTFTIGFDEEGYNEFEYANLIADKYKTNHREIILSGKDYISAMEKLIEYKDAPLSVPNEVPLYLMAKELKKYITVVLSGEGADEIFGGYGRIFRSPHDYNRLKHLDSAELTEEEREEFLQNFVDKYFQTDFDSELDHFLNLYSYTSLEDKKQLLNSNINLDLIEETFKSKFNKYFDELEDDSYYNKMMFAFEKIHIVGLLHRVDTTTMATSVEARVPFVDHRLVEFAFEIPVKYKLKWNNETSESQSKTLMSDAISEKFDTPKYILKKAYEDIIPNEVLYRKKMGFPVPLNNWFGGEFNKYARKILLSDKAKGRGIYNADNIEEWLKSGRLSQDHSFAMKIWKLINLELFINKYLD